MLAKDQDVRIVNIGEELLNMSICDLTSTTLYGHFHSAYPEYAHTSTRRRLMTISTELYSSGTSSNGEPSHSLTDEEKELKKAGYAADAWDTAQALAGKCEIKGDHRWWGFWIEMNHEAAEKYAYMLERIEEHLPKCLSPKMKRAIAFALQLKEHRITAADKRSDYKGCKFVSPWVLPFALTVVRNNSGDDQHLWSTVWDPGENTWGEQSEFNGEDVLSRSGPALAQHGDFLYCVHRGGNDDTALYWTVYTTDDGWRDDQKFPSQLSSTTPSLVEFQEKLYCFYQGAGNSFLYFCRLTDDGNSWENNTHVKVGGNDLNCVNGCGVAVFNEQLHLVYECGDGKKLKHLWTNDFSIWHEVTMKDSWSTSDTPALVAYKGRLLLVHRGNKDEALYYSFYDGSSWSNTENTLPNEHGNGNATSTQGVALAVFDEKVFLVHRSGANNGELWYSTYTNSGGWTNDRRIVGQSTGETPALACYKDPQVKAENYEENETEPGMIVDRLICVHRGWGN